MVSYSLAFSTLAKGNKPVHITSTTKTIYSSDTRPPYGPTDYTRLVFFKGKTGVTTHTHTVTDMGRKYSSKARLSVYQSHSHSLR